MWPILTAGFVLGLAGSLHCLGMCGPLVLAIPARGGLMGWLGYHLARSSSYAALGALAGLLGAGFALVGWQQGLSLGLGLLLLVLLLLGTQAQQWRPLQRAHQLLIGAMHKLMQRAGQGPALIGLGFANGLLPCGLSFAALIGASAMSTPIEGAALMAAFGLGTTPLLLVLPALRQLPAFRGWSGRAARVAGFAVAVLLMLRGLGLGIPLVSPKLSGAPHHTAEHRAAAPGCH